jgi:hypothetical protein
MLAHALQHIRVLAGHISVLEVHLRHLDLEEQEQDCVRI